MISDEKEAKLRALERLASLRDKFNTDEELGIDAAGKVLTGYADTYAGNAGEQERTAKQLSRQSLGAVESVSSDAQQRISDIMAGAPDDTSVVAAELTAKNNMAAKKVADSMAKSTATKTKGKAKPSAKTEKIMPDGPIDVTSTALGTTSTAPVVAHKLPPLAPIEDQQKPPSVALSYDGVEVTRPGVKVGGAEMTKPGPAGAEPAPAEPSAEPVEDGPGSGIRQFSDYRQPDGENQPTPPPMPSAGRQQAQAAPVASLSDAELLAQYDEAVKERNRARASDSNLAAMRAFNYQKAGANISARDLMDENAGSEKLLKYQEQAKLSSKSRENKLQDDALAMQKRKSDADFQGDDPGSDYSLAALEQVADTLGKPELVEKLRGKVSANQIQKIFGNIQKPALIEAGKGERAASTSAAGIQRVAMQQAGAAKRQEESLASRASLQAQRIKAAADARKLAASRLKSSKIKEPEIHAGAMAMGLAPYNPGVTPNPREPTVQKSLQQYSDGRDVVDRISDLQDMVNKASKAGIWGKLSAGEAAKFQTGIGQLVERMSKFNDQGVVRDGDYARYQQQLSNPAEIESMLKNGKRASDQLNYLKSLTGRQMDTVAQGAGYRTARVGQDGKNTSLGELDQDALESGWGIQRKPAQAQTSKPQQQDERTHNIEVKLKDGSVEQFHDVPHSKMLELQNDPDVAGFREL